jgi:hypothetical protein
MNNNSNAFGNRRMMSSYGTTLSNKIFTTSKRTTQMMVSLAVMLGQPEKGIYLGQELDPISFIFMFINLILFHPIF